MCTEFVRNGGDFTTVWTTLLKSHPLVNGLPEAKLADKRGMLDIQLITGERLVYDGDGKKFSVKQYKREGRWGQKHARLRLIFVRTAKPLSEPRLCFPRTTASSQVKVSKDQKR